MKPTAIALAVSMLALLPGLALAQAEHDAHHPGTPPAETGQSPAPALPVMPSMQGMPDQCRAMMQAMPQDCMSAMQQMMQGGMMHGEMTAPATGAAVTTAYIDAMNAMHDPMMDGVMAEDPDVAFVRGMIPHHQGAIDMARIVQQYGDDPQTREWAAEIIAAQEREIADMQAWLAEKGGVAPFDPGQTSGTVYSADEGGSTISAIDLATGSVRAVPVPVAPHNVDLTPDRRFLLAVGTPASGDHGSEDHGHGGGASGLLVILDANDLTGPAATVEIGDHPAHVVSDGQGRAYASLSGANEIAVVDLATASVIARIGTGAYPHGMRLGPDGTELYVANVEDGSVSVIETATLAEVARIPVGSAPVQVGFTPSGDRVYVSLRDENRVAVIDTATRAVISRIEVGPSPIQMMATPDGRFVYVANQGTDDAPNNTVSVIDTATDTVIRTITTGPGAHGVSVSADGAFVFVTNIAADSVSVIDTSSQTVVAAVQVGDRPNGIVYGAAAP